jgi:hypothetical protein
MASKKKVALPRTTHRFCTVPITVNGVVQDLTGWEAMFTVTSDPSPTSTTDADAAIKLSCTLDSTAIATFQVTEAHGAALVPTTPYYWDIRLKDPTGTYFGTITSGTATTNQSYTRRTS